jgi:hypothetical protein
LFADLTPLLVEFGLFWFALWLISVLCELFLPLAETLRPHQAAVGIGISLRILTRLYAADAKVKIQPTLKSPRCLSLRSNAMSFSQPKHSSIRFRLLMIDSAHDLFLNHHAVELTLLFQHPASSICRSGSSDSD